MAACDSCVYYVYDEDWEEYCCTVNVDEDDLARMALSSRYECRYYRLYDEYRTVRRQM